MSDKPETLADIVAQMRRWAKEGVTLVGTGYIADRIEAAAKNTENAFGMALAIEDGLHKRDKQSAPGNAAALRSALESIEDDCRVLDRKDMWEEEGECYYDALRDIREKVNTVLSAPARNVDRFATAEEAVAAFADHLRAWENAHGIFSEYPDHAVKVPAGAFAWLFAPAEGGAE